VGAVVEAAEGRLARAGGADGSGAEAGTCNLLNMTVTKIDIK
jgi:hypothetical protein